MIIIRTLRWRALNLKPFGTKWIEHFAIFRYFWINETQSNCDENKISTTNWDRKDSPMKTLQWRVSIQNLRRLGLCSPAVLAFRGQLNGDWSLIVKLICRAVKMEAILRHSPTLILVGHRNPPPPSASDYLIGSYLGREEIGQDSFDHKTHITHIISDKHLFFIWMVQAAIASFQALETAYRLATRLIDDPCKVNNLQDWFLTRSH